MKRYDTFNDEPEKIPQLKEIDITVRELTPDDIRRKYRARYVKAVLSNDPEKLPDGDELLIRYQRGGLHPERWRIKIVEDISGFKAVEAEIRT